MFKRLMQGLSSILIPKSEEQMLKDLCDADLPKEVRSMLERQTFKFDVAHMILLQKFEIHVPTSKSFNKVCTYIKGGLDAEERVKMSKIVGSKGGRRDAFNFMVEMREITPSKLNHHFPLGEKRVAFERWLDGEVSHLP